MIRPLLSYDDSRDLIKQDRLGAYFRMAPETATLAGYHGYDHLLGHADREHVEEELRFLTEWLEDLRRLPSKTLTPEQRLDLLLFERGHAMLRFVFETMQLWDRNPDAISEVGQILFMMLLYAAEDETQRFTDIAERLEQLPRFVREHQSRTRTPPRRWRDLAVQTTAAMPPFFDALAAAAEAQVAGSLAERIRQGGARAKTITAEYLAWLKTLPVDDAESWILGPERFAELLRLRDLGLSPEEILALGQDYLTRYRAEQRELAIAITGSPDVDAARRRVEADAPRDFAAALAATRAACTEARAFLTERRLVPLPATEQLTIIETPDFLRPLIPFAAIFPPARFDPAQRGIYIVTPPADAADLARHCNYAGLYNTAVHEAYPGHHLQLSTANQSASIMRSSPVVGGKATELVEGWAHYCEELMKTHGFHDSPAERFMMVSDLVWRATRIIIDVRLSQGHMSYDEAVAMLVENARMPEAGARAEVNRYTHSPGYQLSYLVGKHQLLALKEAVKAKEGRAFSEFAFHERLLESGSIPIGIIRREIFRV
ncbi:MAG: DUF885 domain-containing protein [Deltaproteobacteria bacterium]|nr:DUF885 domain-containing protein [Deltaproteobacteria bacterium]